MIPGRGKGRRNLTPLPSPLPYFYAVDEDAQLTYHEAEEFMEAELERSNANSCTCDYDAVGRIKRIADMCPFHRRRDSSMYDNDLELGTYVIPEWLAFVCDVSFCDDTAASIHNGVALCPAHRDDPDRSRSRRGVGK